MTEKVQRWTGTVSASDGGGFVAYGDYLALQARCVELQTEVYKATHRADSFETTNETLKHMKAALQVLADKYEAERDAALAKLKELEAQPSPTALELMREYSNGKQWALEEAAKVCEENAKIADMEHGKSTMFGGVRADQSRTDAAEIIRKLKEGL